MKWKTLNDPPPTHTKNVGRVPIVTQLLRKTWLYINEKIYRKIIHLANKIHAFLNLRECLDKVRHIC
jgi:hypothetical protein